MAKNTILNSVEEVIEDFRIGKPVIVVDDEDRENEGDFIVAAEKITPEIVNFMLKEGRGVLCAPLSEKRCAELGLNMMEENNTSLLGTPFTVTVDLLGNDCTTGVSIHDRAATIRALADPETKPPIWAVWDISIPCAPATRACCAVRGTPRRPSIWPVWPDCSPQAH